MYIHNYECPDIVADGFMVLCSMNVIPNMSTECGIYKMIVIRTKVI